MDTNTNYPFEKLFDTAETTVMNFTSLAKNLPELYKQIMTCTTGLQTVVYDSGHLKSIQLEHCDVGNDQRIVFTCEEQGHTIKIFNNGVEVFSQGLDKKLVQALHSLACLETYFKWQHGIPIEMETH